jgi:murein DD-endopeptidase MepM/ murein hydrolase activator NlpD
MEKKYRLLLLSNTASSVKELNLSKFQIYLITATAFIVFSAFLAVGVSFLSDVMYNFKLNAIREERNNIRNALNLLRNEYEKLDTKMNYLVQQDGQYRRDLGLSSVSPAAKDIGIGGGIDIPPGKSEFFVTEEELLSEIATDKLTELKYKVTAEEKSFAAIYTAIKDQDEMLRYYPSIAPVMSGSLNLISDGFGLRPDPFKSGQEEFHEGIDIRGNIGDPIYVTADGTVMRAQASQINDLGIYIEISHKSGKYGYVTKYGHLSKIEPGIREGVQIKRWQKIGEMGRTGKATGPHLHYQIELFGKTIDPIVANWNQNTYKKFITDSVISWDNTKK